MSSERKALNVNVTLSLSPSLPSAYTQIQPHSLVTQHKQQQQQQQHHHQFVMQQTAQSSQRPQGQLLQTASIQPCPHPVPVLPKPGPHQTAGPHQATIFHSTINTQALHASLGHAKAQPVQLTAINLQIQPTVRARMGGHACLFEWRLFNNYPSSQNGLLSHHKP